MTTGSQHIWKTCWYFLPLVIEGQSIVMYVLPRVQRQTSHLSSPTWRLSVHVPADPPGTEHRCTTGDCPEALNVRQRQAKLPVPRVLADLVWSSLAAASLSSTAGFCRNHKTDAPCQQLGSLHMLSREDPCQIYGLCHIQPNVLLLCELVG